MPDEPVNPFADKPQPAEPAPAQPVATPVNPIVNPPVADPDPTAQPFANPPAAPMVAAAPVAAMQPAPSAKKHKLLWLWILLGVIFLLGAATSITILVAKSGADAAAKDYRAAAKTYLANVYDAAIGSAAQPGDTVDKIKNISQPKLESRFLSGLSGDYTDAKTLQNNVTDAVAKLTSQIQDYQSVYDLYQSLHKLKDSASSLNSTSLSSSNALSVLTQFATLYQQQLTAVKNAKLPSDLAATQTAMISAAQTCSDSISAVVGDVRANDATALSGDETDFESCITPWQNASSSFASYYNNLSSKIRDAAAPIQTLKDGIQ